MLNQYSAKLVEYVVTIIVCGRVLSIVYFRHLFVACQGYLVIHHDKIMACYAIKRLKLYCLLQHFYWKVIRYV